MKKKKKREDVNELSPALAQPSHWSPISVDLQGNTLLFVSRSVFNWMALELRRASNTCPELPALECAPIDNPEERN